MMVLGLDAATALCGVAVVEDEHLLCDYRLKTGFAHAEHLLELLDRALADLKLNLADFDGVALTSGPGLFTGVRVAVSTVKGLLAGSSKPVIPISTLEALAWNLPHSRYPVCPMLDARKEEVYAALFVYEESGELKRLKEDQVIAPNVLVKQLSGPVFFLGDGAVRYRETILEGLGPDARFAPPALSSSMASVVAQLGLKRLRRGEGISLDRLEPVYLRRPDAEVHFEKKWGKG